MKINRKRVFIEVEKGGFYGFTLLALSQLKSPLAFLFFYPFSLPKYSANFFTALAR